MDWFGRTAGTETPRDDTFEYAPHVGQTTWAGVAADIRAAAAELRSDESRVASLFTIGFCFGGQVAFDSPTLGLGLTGAIGFYGSPVRDRGNGMPIPVEVASEMKGSVRGLFGGADGGIPPEAVAAFGEALAAAGVDHRLVSYEDAPHSFFDRKAAEYASASDAAWTEVLTFITARPAPVV
jgi:carboxymethylenebutenolidase